MTTEEPLNLEKEVLPEVIEKDPVGIHMGQVKWFSDIQGYGFVTIISGTEKGKDIFVHHSGIKPANSNYKTLKKGEYVNFNIITGLNGLQAVDITGINGGPLMCDIVMGSRKTGDLPPPPLRNNNNNTAEWQTAPIRSTRPPGLQGPPGPPGQGGVRSVKNYNKYNKVTRNMQPPPPPPKTEE